MKNRIDGKNGKNEQKQKLRDSQYRDLNKEKSFSRTTSPAFLGVGEAGEVEGMRAMAWLLGNGRFAELYFREWIVSAIRRLVQATKTASTAE